MVWVIPLSHKRRGERRRCCVGRIPGILAFCSCVAHMYARVHARVGFLIWGEKAPGKARGPTFLHFYCAEIGFLSEKRSQVARPQCETWISIENGNEVARPPCQNFHSQIFIQKGNAVVRPPCNDFRTVRRNPT